MWRAKKAQRDVARLSGKPLSETLEPSSVLSTCSESNGRWMTSPDLTEYGLSFSTEAVRQTTYFLLANPGLNSTVLFRADILFDTEAENETQADTQEPQPLPAPDVPGFELTRTVVRRLIPRNSQLDRPLDQTCHFYEATLSAQRSESTRFLVVYTPHVSGMEELPFYHPLLRSLALIYDSSSPPVISTKPGAIGSRAEPEASSGKGVMSIHFLPYGTEPVQTRLERTLSKLLDVQIRITKHRLNETPATRSPYAPIKDNVIPRQRVQDTYARLKTKYAADLCTRWVESTEPSKHVFEDLGVAAFLVELWREMYGCVPLDEQQDNQPSTTKEEEFNDSLKSGSVSNFPGFVDIACGNGVLVYILLHEGYSGWGFDARRRKTWGIFPASVQQYLREELYIPKPFADELSSSDLTSPNLGLPDSKVKIHTATPPTFTPDTFIISNHADELTLWTPLLAALLNPSHPPPFLAIPCCSHSLSGARYRHPPQKKAKASQPASDPNVQDKDREEDETGQGKTGDLKALRQSKLAASDPGNSAFNKSSYGSLTDKLVAVAEEVGYTVEKTLLRIPSTRNIGVLGRMKGLYYGGGGTSGIAGKGRKEEDEEKEEEILERVNEIVRKECAREGGVYIAAKGWVERARGLTSGGGIAHSHAHA
ncbi:tRNA (uracil) methyltransferase [Aspergillus lucknowensis]|uniref:tRNA (uracil-O(2)-)-methyltransferase n=1 Tax=Aspergillus lucknowensis TaxID=176173 RepID=A0ABR4M4I8_9EURO